MVEGMDQEANTPDSHFIPLPTGPSILLQHESNLLETSHMDVSLSLCYNSLKKIVVLIMKGSLTPYQLFVHY